jgi:hypothetical protein
MDALVALVWYVVTVAVVKSTICIGGVDADS